MTSVRGMKHVVSRCKQNQPHVFHKAFYLRFLCRTALVVSKRIPWMQRMCRRPKPYNYDCIVCISNGFWPNLGPLNIAPIIGPMPAAQTTRVSSLTANCKSVYLFKVQQNKQFKEATATCKFFLGWSIGLPLL